VGFAGDEEPGSVRASAYFELHIEQGPVLEREAVPLGVVQGIRGIRRFGIDVVGDEAHAGSPMAGRRDALRAAARLIEALAEVGEEAGGASLTTGRLEVSPNAPSVVAGHARLIVDIRGEQLDSPDHVLTRARATAEQLLADGPVAVQLDSDVWTYGPFPFDAGLLDVLRTAADGLGAQWLDMVSPAGHDAGYVADAGVPTAMLFVPCRDGLSHHPAEWAEPEHLELATRVLADSLATVSA
jgi:beta-ureidopropionase / N-carbamoyl-L-amino-acid hydrolase